MSLDTVLAGNISTFPIVPPDDQILVLTAGQLRLLIASAVAEAVTPLEARIDDLEDRLNRAPDAQNQPENSGQVVEDLGAKIETLKAELEDNHIRALTEMALDRQRLARLEAAVSTAPPAPPGAKTAARLEKMRAILRERGSTTFKEMERLLKISPKEMNRLLARMDKRSVEVFIREGDRRQKVLRLKAQIR